MSARAKKPNARVTPSSASDREDDRQGAYDPVSEQLKADDSQPTEHERAQDGGGMQGEPIPTQDVDLPEGVKRQPTGPYSKDKGRSEQLPEHVPKWKGDSRR